MSGSKSDHSQAGDRRLRNIPSIDDRQLHETGACSYTERFTVRRSTVHDNTESDTSSNASSRPLSPTSFRSTDDYESPLTSLTIELRQSHLLDSS